MTIDKPTAALTALLADVLRRAGYTIAADKAGPLYKMFLSRLSRLGEGEDVPDITREKQPSDDEHLASAAVVPGL